jgi:GNAT superfamily N-acetyltransferase
MEYRRITETETGALWEIHRAYKAEIGEEAPGEADRERLEAAIREDRIRFYGAWDGDVLAGCCSVTVGFSTFSYAASGVFEDFYIRPDCRHKGIARELVRLARTESGIGSLTVGCADCDVEMYRALGFTVRLGNLLAFD